MKDQTFFVRLVCLCTFFLSAIGAKHSLIQHERRSLANHDLRRGQRVDGTSVATFKVGLKQRNLDNAHDYLMNISHPSSPHYGKLWSAEEVRKAFAPSPETVEIVRSWLESEGFDVTENRGWLVFESSVASVENLLAAEYHEHESDEGEIRIGCGHYSLPEHVAKHVDFVQPGVTLSVPLQKRSSVPNLHLESTRSTRLPDFVEPAKRADLGASIFPRNASLPPDLQNCGHLMTPTCIRALYHLPDPEELASSYSSATNPLAVLEFGGTWDQADLDQFFRTYAPEIPVGTHPTQAPINTHRVLHGKNGTYQNYDTNGETNLDIYVAYPLIHPQNITVYQLSAFPFGGVFDAESPRGSMYGLQEFLDALDGSFCASNSIPNSSTKDCGVYAPTRVVSISYAEPEIFYSQNYIERQCNEFLKLTLQGTTIVASSGDHGVGDGTIRNEHTKSLPNGCIVRDNLRASLTTPYERNGTIFNPMFPQSCPYVLSVGGTRIRYNETILDPESSMDFEHMHLRAKKYDFTFTSGGGFSNYFSRPNYQARAVESYFSNYDPGYPYYFFNGLNFSEPGNNIGAHGGLYNRGGRGFPDVSAIGQHVPVIFEGVAQKAGGTSAATPLWGAVFTLINEKRLQAGKAPVGFVHPVLYEHPEVFNDIQSGHNPGCFTKGFSAVKGWDPITGLGSPNYPKLLELFMSLP